VYFATALPTADTPIVAYISGATTGPNIAFKNSDSKLYAAVGSTLGASGVTVTTGQWYRLDWDFNINTGGNDVCDVKVEGTTCTQATAAGVSGTGDQFIGVISTATADIYWDDFLWSATAADYPLGAGYVLSYVPNEDGDGSSANRHNGLGANEVERTLTGTDITNTTTTAYQLVDDRPMETAAGDFIAWLTNGTAGDYVEVGYENSVESVAPRTVEAIVGFHDAGGAGTHNFQVTLRESGGATTADIAPATTRNVGATLNWIRAHFATVPGTATAWDTTKFNALRSRFIATDASPDVYLDGLMLEAEFVPAADTLPDSSWGNPDGFAGANQMRQLLANR
jgi:hypothetical protein